MRTAKIVIVGGGFAGASTAWWLRQRGETDVLILERETSPGLQASGQNAAMARQSTPDPFLSRLLAEGVRFMMAPPKEFRATRPLLRRAGSALIGSESQVRKLADSITNILPGGEFEIGRPDRIGGVPYLPPGGEAAALFTWTDGFIDLGALMGGFLDGADVWTRCELNSAAGGKPHWDLDTSRGPVRCVDLVIAAGAWGGPLAAKIGAKPPPLQPTTRHLFESIRCGEYDRELPYIWDLRTECYVRPLGDGRLMLSACDQDPYDPADPLRPKRGQQDILRSKLSTSFPNLSRIPFHRYWCGTRVLTPDGRFVIGPDPERDHLHWAAGLGGHGVTSSPAVGRIAADSILGLSAPPVELAPGRFVTPMD
ncbi:FAD-binding oxidoreductase [bacterium]|nr:FAD-binding oxidoreductase [bacterium]